MKKKERWEDVQAILLKREAEKIRRTRERAVRRGDAVIDEDGNFVYTTGLFRGTKLPPV